ncbi:hypothetical protein [Ferrimonas sp. SCSIO 43195]|uniref:hypothetical protein n=1 Tax=Ferrimonas sp. SCSIO 43195 TaxID=2822844 RepID=UPI002075AE59|nr:hypothetical protein [Ferrimonas sp. SCSIO 43195]USD39596.1 hypothetical protein J8Z22_11165 [Ferrimonas sp. SCSIO 43195]
MNFIRYSISTLVALVIGIGLGYWLPKSANSEKLITPLIIQSECVEDFSSLLDEDITLHETSSDIPFAPSLKYVVIFNGNEAEYLTWKNRVNKVLNKCGRNVFTSFKLSEHLSPQLQKALKDTGAKNAHIHGEYISIYLDEKEL